MISFVFQKTLTNTFRQMELTLPFQKFLFNLQYLQSIFQTFAGARLNSYLRLVAMQWCGTIQLVRRWRWKVVKVTPILHMINQSYLGSFDSLLWQKIKLLMKRPKGVMGTSKVYKRNHLVWARYVFIVSKSCRSNFVFQPRDSVRLEFGMGM